MIFVSACLLGENCKYSGGHNKNDAVIAFLQGREYKAVCPEYLGGLPTPRPPAEIRGDTVMDREGKDVTAFFRRGAEKTLALAQKYRPALCILKANSPSCGVGAVYDGSFSGKLIPGDGLAAAVLKAAGFRVVTERFSAEDVADMER